MIAEAKATIEDVIRTVRKLAAESPDTCQLENEGGGFSCKYAGGNYSDGGCGCIFGRALSLLGYDPIFFDDMPNTESSIQKTWTPDIDQLLEHLKIDGCTPERAWCSCVQRLQDQGSRWGDCIREADHMHGELYAD